MPQLKSYQHFIFDFDGVICDSLGPAIEAFNRIREDHFPTLPFVAGREDMTTVYGGSLRTCLDQWLSADETRRFFDLHSAAMAARIADLSAFPGICEGLATLGSGSVSIVTSAYSEAVNGILAKETDFNPSCLYRIAGRELRQSKTEKINNILSDLGLSAADAVYIGDLESDILYCRDVPIDIIAVGYGYHPQQYLMTKNPTYCAGSVSELRLLLQSLVASNINSARAKVPA